MIAPVPYHAAPAGRSRATGRATAARVLAALAGRGWLTAGAVARLAGVSGGQAANALTDARVEVRVTAVRGWCEYRLREEGVRRQESGVSKKEGVAGE